MDSFVTSCIAGKVLILMLTLCFPQSVFSALLCALGVERKPLLLINVFLTVKQQLSLLNCSYYSIVNVVSQY